MTNCQIFKRKVNKNFHIYYMSCAKSTKDHVVMCLEMLKAYKNKSNQIKSNTNLHW